MDTESTESRTARVGRALANLEAMAVAAQAGTLQNALTGKRLTFAEAFAEWPLDLTWGDGQAADVAVLVTLPEFPRVAGVVRTALLAEGAVTENFDLQADLQWDWLADGEPAIPAWWIAR